MQRNYPHLDALPTDWSQDKEKPVQLYVNELFNDLRIRSHFADLTPSDDFYFEEPMSQKHEDKIEKKPCIIITNCNQVRTEVICASNQVSNTSNIGYQRHCIDVSKISHFSVSLGEYRTAPKTVEPLLRDASSFTINLNALRHAEAPNVKDNFPSGLNTEEICQLARYAGEANKMDMLQIVLDTGAKKVIPESMIIAQIIWYFLEGMGFDKSIHPSTSTEFQEYLVEAEHTYHFYKSHRNNKWWIKNLESGFTACSFEEYTQTKENGLPERLLYAI